MRRCVYEKIHTWPGEARRNVARERIRPARSSRHNSALPRSRQERCRSKQIDRLDAIAALVLHAVDRAADTMELQVAIEVARQHAFRLGRGRCWVERAF